MGGHFARNCTMPKVRYMAVREDAATKFSEWSGTNNELGQGQRVQHTPDEEDDSSSDEESEDSSDDEGPSGYTGTSQDFFMFH